MNSLTKRNSTKLLPRWTSASFIALSVKKIWSNYLKLIKMSTSKTRFLKSWWSHKTYKANKFIYQAVLQSVFMEQWWPRVPRCLRQPEVHMNDMFTFCYFFCWSECFPKLTTINHCKHSPALHPQKMWRQNQCFINSSSNWKTISPRNGQTEWSCEIIHASFCC